MNIYICIYICPLYSVFYIIKTTESDSFSFVGSEMNDWGTVNFGQTMANHLQKWLLTKVDTLIVMATVRCFLHFRCATG